jgi:putative ubiquitin-RnfH superfamily antitoxin RatB of RatAB toxin-antitoxin module
MATPAQLRCEVVYALPERQWVFAVALPAGATVRDALAAAPLEAHCPELAPALAAGTLIVGVYGRVVPLDQALRDGDRVEIYRPLKADPKEARRIRAARQQRQPRRP